VSTCRLTCGQHRFLSSQRRYLRGGTSAPIPCRRIGSQRHVPILELPPKPPERHRRQEESLSSAELGVQLVTGQAVGAALAHTLHTTGSTPYARVGWMAALREWWATIWRFQRVDQPAASPVAALRYGILPAPVGYGIARVRIDPAKTANLARVAADIHKRELSHRSV